MNRPDGSVVVVAALVVLATLPVVVAGGMSPAGAGDGTTDQAAAAAQDADTPPGAQLAGVVGVQGEEVEGELSQRRLAHQLAAARSNASKASVVAEQVSSVQERLSTLRERKDDLVAARQNGSMSRGEYRARVATLAARISTLERLAAASSQAATDLPEQALAEQGVNVAALDDIRADAAELRGGEVAAIATAVAGPDVGRPVGVGPPENPGNGTPGGPASDGGDAEAGQGGGDAGNGDDDGADGAPGKGSDGAGADNPGESNAGNATSGS